MPSTKINNIKYTNVREPEIAPIIEGRKQYEIYSSARTLSYAQLGESLIRRMFGSISALLAPIVRLFYPFLNPQVFAYAIANLPDVGLKNRIMY